MINYPEYFRRARMLERFAYEQAGLSPEQARALGERLAAAPVPREQMKRMRILVQERRDARAVGGFQVIPGADRFIWDEWAPVSPSTDDEGS